MRITDIIEVTNSQILTPRASMEREVHGGCGADLMSDVLAAVKPESLLLTGLCNIQVIRTAQMADLAAIIFVRGKTPPQEVIDLAEQENIPLLSSPYGTFELCGRLHVAGLPSAEMVISMDDNAD